jgi:S1-C subfamily serine protease
VIARSRVRRAWGHHRFVLAVATVLAGAGCVESPDASAFPATTEVPRVVSSIAGDATDGPTPIVEGTSVRARSIERRAREMTVRIRTTGCGELATGSGFAVGDGLIVTNRHVVEGAREVSLNTWDGGSFDARVLGADYGDDLALIRVDAALPTSAMLAPDDPEPDTAVMAVGFPLGGQQTVARGAVVDYARLRRADGPQILRLSAEIWPGNSGGPLLDDSGRVVGVVFAIERATDLGLAVPVSQLRQMLDAGAPATVPAACQD